MEWVQLWFMFLLFTTCAGLGYFAGWQHGWAAHKSLETPAEAMRKLT